MAFPHRPGIALAVAALQGIAALSLLSCSASGASRPLLNTAASAPAIPATHPSDGNPSGGNPQLLRTAVDVPMPGRAVRFDYQSLDTGSDRLYISHMNDAHVVIFNVKTRSVVANVAGVPGSTGVLAVPQNGQVYASCSRTGELAVIDPGAARVIARAPAGEFPDGIAYDPGTGKLFVSDESGGADIVIDTHTNRQVARIPLGGGVGNTQFDPVSGQILVTVGDRDQLATIDPRTNQVVGRLPLPGSRHPHGLYIDAPHRLAFIACEENSRLLTLDLRSMKVISVQAVGDDPDVLAFDPGLQRLYVACESGIVSIFDEKGSGLVKRGDLFVAPAAHSIAVDPRTHLVYLPLQDVQGKPVLRIMAPA